jgi:hypothetical protein
MDTSADLDEFPAGYVGRKTYVLVQGRFVASCYTYVGYDGRRYLYTDESGLAKSSDTITAPYIMKDIGSYQSPLDGSMITSRSAHREHLKTHDVIEVGNEPIGKMKPTVGDLPARERMETIKRHVEKVKAMPQAQYDQHVRAVANGD